MNVLTQQRWFSSLVAILSEVPSLANDAALQLGRWLGASSKEADARIVAGTVAAGVVLAVAIVLLLSMAAGR